MQGLKLVAIGVALPVLSFCQAFLSPQGEGSVSVLYQYSIDRLHAFSDGRTKDLGHMYWNTVALDTDYSLTDRLAVRLTLPFVDGKYVGSAPHQVIRGNSATNVMLDDGAYHGTVTDLRVDIRYSLTRGKLKIVPDFQATLPAHPYPTFLHAVYGSDLTQGILPGTLWLRRFDAEGREHCPKNELRRISSRLLPRTPRRAARRDGGRVLAQRNPVGLQPVAN